MCELYGIDILILVEETRRVSMIDDVFAEKKETITFLMDS